MIEKVEVRQQEFRFEEHLQVSGVGPSIPVVCDVATVHDLTKDVFQVFPRNNVVLAEIVVKHISTDCQVTIVETVDSAPTLGTEFLSSHHQGVEVAQSKQTSLELVRFFIAFVDELLIEVGIGSSQVSLQVLRSFVGHLDGCLENGFRDDLHIWQRRRL